MTKAFPVNRWENLVKNDPDLVMIVEGEEIKFINDAGARMYGSQPEDLVGSNLFQLITVEESDKARQRLQAVSNGEEVEPYIHNITHPLTGGENSISFELDVEPLILNVNQAVPFAMIMNELITNSFKHAFKDQDDGKVKVSIRQEEGTIRAVIQDNGTGIKENFLQTSDSMGITIVKTLIDQLEANIKAENKNGACITFNFKHGNLKGAHSNLVN